MEVTRIGDLLLMARRQKGITSRQLAEMSGVSMRTISWIEADHHRPRLKTAKALAGALDVPVETIYPEE